MTRSLDEVIQRLRDGVLGHPDVNALLEAYEDLKLGYDVAMQGLRDARREVKELNARLANLPR